MKSLFAFPAPVYFEAFEKQKHLEERIEVRLLSIVSGRSETKQS